MNYDLEDIQKIDVNRMFEQDMAGMILNLIEDWKEMHFEIEGLNNEILEYGLR